MNPYQSIIQSSNPPFLECAKYDPLCVFRPQVYLCGLNFILPKMNFIGSLDNIARDSRALLEKAGLWDSYGVNYKEVSENHEARDSKERGNWLLVGVHFVPTCVSFVGAVISLPTLCDEQN